MKSRDLVRYCRDLGWRDPLEVAAPATPPPQTAPGHARPTSGFASLEELGQHLQGCTECRLSKGRRKVVFGEGSASSGLMFIGEGPGSEEDRSGRPFVGQAGQLLDGMIQALGLSRESVYIANVVKCRPPGNRTPEREEIETCAPFLFRQIEVIRPMVICCLGATAVRCLLGLNDAMARLRGRWFDYRGIHVAVTYHPAFLLRDPRQKKEAWKDLQMVMEYLGLKPRKSRPLE